MGVDYTAELVVNGKTVAKMFINEIKLLKENFIDTEDSSSEELTSEKLEAWRDSVKNKIKIFNEQIVKLELKSCLAANSEIKHEYEDEIFELKEDLVEMSLCLENISEIFGMVNFVLGNQIYDDSEENFSYAGQKHNCPDNWKLVVKANY